METTYLFLTSKCSVPLPAMPLNFTLKVYNCSPVLTVTGTVTETGTGTETGTETETETGTGTETETETGTVTGTETETVTGTGTHCDHTGTRSILLRATSVTLIISIASKSWIVSTSQGNLHSAGFFVPSIASCDKEAAPAQYHNLLAFLNTTSFPSLLSNSP